MDRCRALTLNGTRCTKKASRYGCCNIPAHQKQSVEEPTSSPKSPPKSMHKPPKSLQKKERGQKVPYGDLGFVQEKAMEYIYPSMYSTQGNILVPTEEFSIVSEQIMKLCKETKIGFCMINPIYPGIQWDNERENTDKENQLFKDSMYMRGNHYFHRVENNNINIFGKEDLNYCHCQETKKTVKISVDTLLMKDNDPRWNEYHGQIYIKDKFIDRILTSRLKQKIREDSFQLLAQEYKIHLQPKPEYQLGVISVLMELINDDMRFRQCIDAWKAIIPYSKVIGESKIPAIVIYPISGRECAQYLISAIISKFRPYDVEEIGLNITPRYNYKYNSLIYWAGGSGDHKNLLSIDYFSTPEKIFYKGYELITS